MATASNLERAMEALINDERTSRGLDPLTLELQLNESADAHTDWMFDSGVFSHTGQGGSSAGDRMRDAGFDFSGSWSWGENIAWQTERGAPGLLDDVEDLHNSLMNSPGHRANLLSPGFDYIGIGIEQDSFRGYDAVMVTQNFARTSAQVQIDTAAAAPELTAQGVTLSAVKGAKTKKLAKLLPDGASDTFEFFELRDTEGRHNFRSKTEGKLPARDGVVVDAEDLGDIRVARNIKVGETEVEIRAFDGAVWTDWTTLEITTLSPDDWLALA